MCRSKDQGGRRCGGHGGIQVSIPDLIARQPKVPEIGSLVRVVTGEHGGRGGRLISREAGQMVVEDGAGQRFITSATSAVMAD